MRFSNIFLTYMVWKYQNEIAPIFYYGISTKTNEKDLKIPNLQSPDWKSPYWMTLYIYLYQWTETTKWNCFGVDLFLMWALVVSHRLYPIGRKIYAPRPAASHICHPGPHFGCLESVFLSLRFKISILSLRSTQKLTAGCKVQTVNFF